MSSLCIFSLFPILIFLLLGPLRCTFYATCSPSFHTTFHHWSLSLLYPFSFSSFFSFSLIHYVWFLFFWICIYPFSSSSFSSSFLFFVNLLFLPFFYSQFSPCVFCLVLFFYVCLFSKSLHLFYLSYFPVLYHPLSLPPLLSPLLLLIPLFLAVFFPSSSYHLPKGVSPHSPHSTPRLSCTYCDFFLYPLISPLLSPSLFSSGTFSCSSLSSYFIFACFSFSPPFFLCCLNRRWITCVSIFRWFLKIFFLVCFSFIKVLPSLSSEVVLSSLPLPFLPLSSPLQPRRTSLHLKGRRANLPSLSSWNSPLKGKYKKVTTRCLGAFQ